MSLGRNPQDERTAGPGRHRGRIIVLAVLLAALGLGAVPVSAAAVAGRGAAAVPSVVLCSGYRGCDRAGYDSYGYGEHGRSSYWRMDAGNECTNYVAYVEARYFRVATPGYRLGNAYQWPAAAAAHGVTVSKVPSVGSVAVWDGGAYGIGPDGHVAVVERVGPRHRYIVVSQQHLRGVANGYEWTRINAGFPAQTWESWPSQSFTSGSAGTARCPPCTAAVPRTAALPGTGTATAAVTVVTSGTITGATDTTAATGARITGTTVITTTGTTGTTAGTDTGGPAERTQPCHTNALVRTSPPAADSAGRCAARQW